MDGVLMGRVPDYLIIGAQRSGTTSLYRYLALNSPTIPVTKHKELHYFDWKYHKCDAWYLKHFIRKAGAFMGECSPFYLYCYATPYRVWRLAPEAKLVVILRNPVDRAYSNYWHIVGKGRESLSFPAALDQETARKDSYGEKALRNWVYLDCGKYVEQLLRWFVHFPCGQFHIGFSEDFYKNTEVYLQDVLAFLGQPSNSTFQFPKVYNKKKYPPMAASLRKELVAYYEPYNAQLEGVLGRKVPKEWHQ